MPAPIKKIHSTVCVFDLEFVPDTVLGRRLLEGVERDDGERYTVESLREMNESEIASTMQKHFAVDRGIMKSIMYQIVSVAAMIRKQDADGRVESLKLFSLPTKEEKQDEIEIIRRFLTFIGTTRPQIVGYATQTFDLTALYQRAISHGVRIKEFCTRPEKPWDDYADYFSPENAYNVDLVKVVGNFGTTVPKLEQIALACKIPAKIGGIDGSKVAGVFYNDGLDSIVAYNECDALTTYLLWLRVAYVNGHFTDEQYAHELTFFLEYCASLCESRPHVKEFLDEMQRLNARDITVLKCAGCGIDHPDNMEAFEGSDSHHWFCETCGSKVVESVSDAITETPSQSSTQCGLCGAEIIDDRIECKCVADRIKIDGRQYIPFGDLFAIVEIVGDTMPSHKSSSWNDKTNEVTFYDKDNFVIEKMPGRFVKTSDTPF